MMTSAGPAFVANSKFAFFYHSAAQFILVRKFTNFMINQHNIGETFLL